ncbi:TPA: hypothetical protein ACNVQ0_006485 [Pseudomonas aeruginosa]
MIPATHLHPLRYIGGMAALNLPSSTGTGDWHFWQTFERERRHRSRSFISGAGCATDTTALLGDAGIYEVSELLRTLGIRFEGGTAYAASHARACADLVLAAVMRGLSPDFVTLDDWMPREIDKQAVHCLIDRALPRLDATQAEAVKAWQSRLSFSEGDCTSSLGWPPCVHRTSDRERSEVLCTKRRERSELLRTLVHGATKPEPPKIPAINRQAA